MMDFTLKKFNLFLETLQKQGFQFLSLRDYISRDQETSTRSRIAILRHDVDARPENSLTVARIEHALGIQGTYYFRVVPECFKEPVIRAIADMGHEIGYHYETMERFKDLKPFGNEHEKPAHVKRKAKDETKHGDRIDHAYAEFCRNLEMFRQIVRIDTICMHGSPRSAFDNREIWKKYDYKSLGLLAEPYLDIDFNQVFYLTDTGRCWDGWKFSIRDKIPQQKDWSSRGLTYHTTSDIIAAALAGTLPEKILITFHPQRWSGEWLQWTRELLFQNMKNGIKYLKLINRPHSA